jgi:hypothetical protein
MKERKKRQEENDGKLKVLFGIKKRSYSNNAISTKIGIRRAI